jgi:hypothetical protein
VPEVPAPEGMPLPADEKTQPTWRDSSLDLENGLDVIELQVDVVCCAATPELGRAATCLGPNLEASSLRYRARDPVAAKRSLALASAEHSNIKVDRVNRLGPSGVFGDLSMT